MIVNKGSLWIGKKWKEAIKLSLETCDCGIEPVYKDKYPNKLFDNERILIGYQLFGFGNNRKYKTRIPKQFNSFVEKILNVHKEVV